MDGAMRTNTLLYGVLTSLVAAVMLVSAGCLEEDNPPELSGPSGFGTEITLRAIPDRLTSDGFSSAVIEAVVFDSNGNRTRASRFYSTSSTQRCFDSPTSET